MDKLLQLAPQRWCRFGILFPPFLDHNHAVGPFLGLFPLTTCWRISTQTSRTTATTAYSRPVTSWRMTSWSSLSWWETVMGWGAEDIGVVIRLIRFSYPLELLGEPTLSRRRSWPATTRARASPSTEEWVSLVKRSRSCCPIRCFRFGEFSIQPFHSSSCLDHSR